MSIATQDLRSIVGHGGSVRTTHGDKIGSIGQFYLDDATGEPSWVTVRTGLFGTKETFVPLRDATNEGVDILVDCDKETVKDAPRIDVDNDLSPQEEEELYRHYGMTPEGLTTQGVTGQGMMSPGAEAQPGQPGLRESGLGESGPGEHEHPHARLRRYRVPETGAPTSTPNVGEMDPTGMGRTGVEETGTGRTGTHRTGMDRPGMDDTDMDQRRPDEPYTL